MLKVSTELVNYFMRSTQKDEVLQWIKQNVKEKDKEYFLGKLEKTVKVDNKETMEDLVVYHIYQLTFLPRGFLQQDRDFRTYFVGFEVR